jgi:hypothetical protein
MSTNNGAVPSGTSGLAALRRLLSRWPTVGPAAIRRLMSRWPTAGPIALFGLGAGLVCWLYVSEVAKNLETSKQPATAGAEQAAALRQNDPGAVKKPAAELTSAVASLKQGLDELSAGLEQDRQALQQEHDRREKQIDQLAADLAQVQQSVQRESEQVRRIAEELATNIGPVKQALQQQRDSTAPQEEVERVGRVNAVTAEVGQLKQAIGALTADLDKVRQTLAQESDNSARKVSQLATEVAEAKQSAQREREKVDRLELRLTTDLDHLKEFLNRESTKNEKLVRESSADVAEIKKALRLEAENRTKTADELTAGLVQLNLAVRELTADLAREKQSRQQESGKTGEQPQQRSAEQPVTKQSPTPEAVEIPRQEGQQSRGPDKQLATRSDAMPEGNANGSTLPQANAPATDRDKPAQPSSDVGDAAFQRLMSRASLLLSQGNIGAARAVLERAAETGNARALFALAETFDPVVLSAWGAVGTRGDATRAQELYAKALAGGVQEAKSRLTR